VLDDPLGAVVVVGISNASISASWTAWNSRRRCSSDRPFTISICT
jgi:hypothetical protein